MSLLLNGARTMTFAGTEIQCLELYTGEAYTLPINFTTAAGAPANALVPAAWSIDASAKFYSVDTVQYPDPDTVVLGNLTLLDPQPANTAYTLIADWISQNIGTAYLYLGADITNSGNNTPVVDLANTTDETTLVIVTLEVAKQSTANAALTDISREPIGFTVRFQ